MTTFLPDDTKEQVRQATDIVELVGQSIQLRRQGRNFVGLCPWHKDSRPSLQVNPERQTWKCWPCNIGGDVFEFVKQQEKVDFREALRMLADRAGIELKQSMRPKPAPGTAGDKATLYEVLAWAERQYHEHLLSAAEAQPCRTYLKERGISQESIERYGLGCSPTSWRWISSRAGAKWSPQVMEATGLVVSRDDGSQYDRFRGRVLFPIRNPQGRAIAFGGRVLPENANDKTPKYINSPETRLYSKSENVYGFDVVRDQVNINKRVVVMEGYTDVVMARQAGLPDCVAVLGTALGPKHVQLLSRFADQIVLVLDGDEAGQKRTNEVLELFIARQVDLRIVTLPADLDPCDFISQNGLDQFEKLLGSARDALEHKLHTTLRGFDPRRDTHQASAALEDILSTMAKAPPVETTSSPARLRQQQVLRRLSREFDLKESDLRNRLSELRRATPSPGPESDRATTGPVLLPWERELLEFLTRFPDSISLLAESIGVDDLTTETARAVFQMYLQADEQSLSTGFSQMLAAIEDSETKNLLVELDESAHRKCDPDRDDWLVELMDSFQRRRTDRDSHQRKLEIDSGDLDSETKLSLLEQIIQEKRNRQGISAPTDG